VQGSVTVHARDSLGNVNTDPVAVVLDTVAPNGIGLKDGLGLDLSSGNSVHRDTVTGLAGLVVSASDSSGFFVSLKDSTDHLVGTQPGRNGSTRFDSLPVGTLRVVIEDSLGNRVQGTSEGVWGAFVVRPLLSKPVFNLPGGTYGGESTVYTDVMRRDLLQLKISCSDKADLIWRDSSSSTWSKTSAPFPTFQVGGGVIVSRCVNGVDSSLTDRRTYVVLQRPWIKMSDSLYAVDSLIVPIAIDSAGRFSKNPPTAKIQYCIGADTSEANWQNYSKDIVIKGTQTLRARVYDGEKYSHSSKRSFVQRAVTNWSRTFSSSQTATDTVALRNLYQAIAWSHYPFDTLSVSTANTGLDLTVNWKITGRVPKSYGYFGVDLFLDSDYSLYDFSAVDSITYDYIATGKYSDLLLYPVAADDDGSGYALNCQEAPNKAGAGHAVCRPGTIDLAYPAWDPTEPVVKKFWSDIRGSIKSLRIQAAPQSNSTGVPVDAKSTLTISKVNIYGKILKKP